MSQSNPFASQGPVSLPLLKYSCATDRPDATKFTWKHIFQDLLIVFDNYGSDRYGHQPSSIMKVLQGASVLDHVDLIEKVRECEAAVDHARKVKIELRADQLPTSALYRRMNSTIALRYQLPDNKVRRIQLKFTSVQDFDTALAILDDVRCPLHNSAPPGEAGRTAPTRPVTASSALTRITEQPNATFAVQRPASASSRPFHIPQNASDDNYNSEATEGPTHLHTSSSEHFPTSQHIYRSYTSSFAPPSQNVHSYRPSTPLTPIRENEPTIYSDPVMQNIRAFDTRSRRIDPLRPRSAISLTDDHGLASIQTDPVLPNASMDSRLALTGSSRFFSTDRQSHQRPSTATFSGPSETDITSMIPPRRELPFKRPSSSRDGSSSSRPSTATDLHPLPIPNFAQASLSNDPEALSIMTSPAPLARLEMVAKQSSNEKGASKTASKRRATVTKENPLKVITPRRPSSKVSSGSGTASGAPKPTTRDDSLSIFHSNTPSGPGKALRDDSIVPHNVSSVQYIPIEDLSTHFFPTSSHRQSSEPTDVPVVNTLRPHSLLTPDPDRRPQTSINLTTTSRHTNPDAMPIGQDLKSSLDRIGHAFTNTPAIAETDKENLASYVVMNHSDRMSVLENMIITSVSDENFATLCEDVYGCWQRIGFGV